MRRKETGVTTKTTEDKEGHEKTGEDTRKQGDETMSDKKIKEMRDIH